MDEEAYFDTLVVYVDSVKGAVALLAARQRLVGEEQDSETLIAKNAEYEESERHRQYLAKDFHALESFFVKDNENVMGSPEICEIHRVALKRAKVRLLYGTPIHDEDFAALIAARSTSFPNSRTHFLGGCTLRLEPRTEALVCVECRHAEREWSETTGLPIEPKIGGMLIT